MNKPTSRRRAMPAGHAVLVVLVAFAVGTLLNADSIMRTAENLPLGSTKRAVAVGVMRPVRWVSDHLQITEPRDALDRALGKDQPTVDDPFTAFTSPPTARSAPTTAKPNGTTTPGQTTSPST